MLMFSSSVQLTDKQKYVLMLQRPRPVNKIIIYLTRICSDQIIIIMSAKHIDKHKSEGCRQTRRTRTFNDCVRDYYALFTPSHYIEHSTTALGIIMPYSRPHTSSRFSAFRILSLYRRSRCTDVCVDDFS